MEFDKKPLVTIITVSLNSAKYIKDTIESVLQQNYENLEYIIIDGNSTDKTIDIIKKYEPLFKGRMKWISEKDKGMYEAMNKGIKMASGEIIGIINSDDWYEKDIMAEIVKKIQVYDMLHGQMRFVDSKKKIIKVYSHKKGTLKRYMCTPYNHPTMFIKKYVYDSLGLFNESYITAGDYDFMLRFYNSKFRDIYLNKVIANFRTVGITSTNEIITNKKEIIKVLNENGLPLFLSNLFVYYRIIRMKIAKKLKKYFFIINICRRFSSYHVKKQ
jgi:glycosyltransferase involved in cell wall biosynthesis